MLCNNISNKPKCWAKEAHFSLAPSRELDPDLHNEGNERGCEKGRKDSQEGTAGTRILLTAPWAPSRSPPTSCWECPTHRSPQGATATPALCILPTYTPNLWRAPCACSQWWQPEWALADGQEEPTESWPKSEGQGETTNLSFHTTFVKTK